MPRASRARAFTLVELLVVIGIIAVLIGILLPTLNRAREAAKRTECLSNMRSIYAMLKMYENQFKGASPLGTSGTITGAGAELQASYFLCRGGAMTPNVANTSVRLTSMGLMFMANIVKEDITTGRVFYCPSFQGDVNHDYNVPTNPWPPSNVFYDGLTTASHGCRMSYSQRPILTMQPFSGQFWTYKVVYDKDTPDPRAWLLPKAWPSGSAPAGVVAHFENPKLKQLKNAAIFSDINAGEGRLAVGHKKGMNVLYNTGGAKWVDVNYKVNFTSGFNSTLQQLITSETTFGTGNDATQIQIWMTLDQL